MTLRPRRSVAILLVLLLTLLDPLAEAQSKKKKRKSTPRKKTSTSRRAAPKPVVSVPVGRTFEERLSSLVNGSVARARAVGNTDRRAGTGPSRGRAHPARDALSRLEHEALHHRGGHRSPQAVV